MRGVRRSARPPPAETMMVFMVRPSFLRKSWEAFIPGWHL